jgi:hypothetical protein
VATQVNNGFCVHAELWRCLILKEAADHRAASTTEAEYIAAGMATRRDWLRKLMADLRPCMGNRPINIGIDNQAALALSRTHRECAGQAH